MKNKIDWQKVNQTTAQWHASRPAGTRALLERVKRRLAGNRTQEPIKRPIMAITKKQG